MSTSLADLQRRLVSFRDARDWAQFHNAKDLAAAIATEAGELQELFLWKNSEEVDGVLRDRREDVECELADVLIRTLNFAATTGIDVLDALERKIKVNEMRYPVEKARGSSAKHTEL